MKSQKFLHIPFYPFFIGVYPALFFLGQNISEVEIVDSGRVFIFVLTSICLFFLVFRLLLRDWDRAAMLSSIVTSLFFSYGHIYTLLKQVEVLGVTLGRHRYLMVIFFILLILGTRWVLIRKDFSRLTWRLNLLGFLICLLPVIQILSFTIITRSSNAQSIEIDQTALPTNIETYPDIYYIIPDAYTRDDILMETFSFDNSAFLEALEERGFYIARCSLSNYAWTRLSLGSSLNMDYIHNIVSTNDLNGLEKPVRDNLVVDFFHRMGYTIIAFDSAFPPTSLMHHIDYFYSYEQKDPIFFRGLYEYEALFFRTTAGIILLDIETLGQGELLELVDESPKRDRYARIEYNLDKLETVPYMPGPKFVFAHINIPHEPYIFDKSGEFVPNQTDEIEGYRQQIEYVNSRLLSLVDIILAQSDTPPIIIIQGDHGSGETINNFQRMRILNAYYLPDEGTQALYPQISPVNTFRLVLDLYFDSAKDLLPDVSYYSHWQDVGAFEVVPITRQGCEP